MLKEEERHGAACDPWLHMRNELETVGRRRLFVVPSVQSTFDRVTEWSLSRSRPVLIGRPTMRGLLGSTHLLNMLKDTKEHDPFTAVVFSDQLTSAADAPMLIEKSGRPIFLSAIEVIAYCNYMLEIHIWTGNRFEATQESPKPEDILLTLYRYLTACERSGRDWLAVGYQAERYPKVRIAQAQMRLQMLQSTIMHAFLDSALPLKYQAIIERAVCTQKHLNTAAF